MLRALVNHPKVVPWEIEIQFCNWRALKLNVKRKWTMLRDYYIHLGSDPYYDNLVFLRVDGNLNDCRNPQFCTGPTSFSRAQHNIRQTMKHYPLATMQNVFIHSNFLGPHTLHVQCKVNLGCPWLLERSHNLYITCQRPSSSSVKWSYLLLR